MVVLVIKLVKTVSHCFSRWDSGSGAGWFGKWVEKCTHFLRLTQLMSQMGAWWKLHLGRDFVSDDLSRPGSDVDLHALRYSYIVL